MMRSDFAAIAKWVEPGSQVLDVGCGDGSLLHHLKEAKQAHVYGVELADDKVLACAQKGLNVVQQDLEGGLALFEDQSFDKVILSQTLQTIHQTARILSEIARVGKECVVSFPNFGHWSHRSAVLLGRMPVSKSLPYQWYDTPNVRVLTIADFEALAPAVGLELLDRVVFHDGQSVEFLPNLRGSLAVYRARRAK
ncbi:MAG: methionine biosynthesis protein MetW [Pseudomonadota bacterium]|jgi:methionine biosynthesis protein MetW|uniref:methionine biosynthesis protein MetW n=1 Tax=Polynucleobacter sp. MWH-CaK5 TaxID=2689107 RepID=UPI001BFE6867|nr:methionine biosynthesis protein MetW [Polynucleobacter sp. MWH-CaK5]QWD88863.1 methionine biosynthesis protein MetW [Polynucleobacter sp. MWH-CaK5]